MYLNINNTEELLKYKCSSILYEVSVIIVKKKITDKIEHYDIDELTEYQQRTSHIEKVKKMKFNKHRK